MDFYHTTYGRVSHEAPNPKSEVYNIDRIQSIISKAFIMHYKEEIQRQHTQNIERKLSGKDGVRTAEHTLPGIKMKVTNSWICTAVSMAKGGYLLIASIMLRELLVSNNSTNHRSDMVIVRPSWIWDFVNLSQTSLNDSKEAVDVRNIIRMISGKKNCEEVINHTAAKSAACEDQRVLLSSSHAALFAAVWLMCLRIYAIKNSGEPTSFDLEAVKYISTTMSFSSVASDFFSRAGPLEETLTSLSALHKPSCWIFIQHMLEMTASVSRQSIQEDTSGAFIDCTPVASLLSTRVFSDARLHQHAEKTMYSLLVTLMAALERISDAEAIAIAKEQTVFDEDMISLEKDKKSQSVLSSHQFNRQIIAKKEEFEEKLQKIKTQYTGVATKIQQKIELYCDELVVILHHLHESDHEEAYLKATKVINTILTISSSNEKQINFIKNKKTSLLASSSILWQKRLELERLQCFRKSSATKWINTPLAQQKYNRLMNLLVVSTEQRCRHNPLLWKMRLEVLIDYNDWTSSNNNISDKNAPSFEALANAALKDCPIFLGNLKEDRVDDGVSLVISTTDSKFRAGDLTNKHVEYLSACVELRITLATIIFQRKSGTAATTMLDDTIARLERLSDGISANMMIETRKTDVSHLTCNVEVLYLRVTGMIASVWNTKAKLLRNHTLGIDVDNQWKDQLINRGEIRVPAMTQEIESCLKLGLKRQSTALCYIEAQLKLRQGSTYQRILRETDWSLLHISVHGVLIMNLQQHRDP